LYIADNGSYLDEWIFSSVRDVFKISGIGQSDIYSICFDESYIQSGVNDGGFHLGDISCVSSDIFTYAGSLWRFQNVGGAYRIFSLENCVLGEEQYALGILDGNVVKAEHRRA